ncbi:uncharacterized protein PgNI_02974 [Pyricularia grisea]|uniref:Uncharacterized protein n=1 Tax=Pyricularia grisea TaxID=148305 RepID=A0A6P8BDA0_PYRGI|nr:uncharacterized protein PgNI_02974 [Pyricularia grisea]TLD13810.1 hypothetical protein PgNI_02974 [Pyricularia grisea]
MGWAAVSVPQNRGPLQPHRLFRHGRRDQAKQSGGTQPGKHVIQTQKENSCLICWMSIAAGLKTDDAHTWAEIPKTKLIGGTTAALSVLLQYIQSPVKFCFGAPRLHNIYR